MNLCNKFKSTLDISNNLLLDWGVESVEKYYDTLAEDYDAAVRAWGYCLPEACIDSLVKYAQFDVNDTNVTVLDLGCGAGWYILINSHF